MSESLAYAILFVGIMFVSGAMTAWSAAKGREMGAVFWSLMTTISASLVVVGLALALIP